MRHAAAREASQNRLLWLDLVDRDRIRGGGELDEVAKLERLARVDELDEALVRVPRPLADRCLHGLHHLGVGRMRVAALAVLDEARVQELRRLRARRFCACACVLLELLEPDGAGVRRGRGKERVDHVAGEAEHVEQLGPAVRVEVGDAHLRHHLQHPVLDRRAVPLLCLGGGRVVAAELVRGGELGDRLEREARADRVGSEAEQAREVVCLPRLVALHDDRRVRPQSGRDEPVVHRGEREQRRDRRASLGGRAVAEQQNLTSGADALHRLGDDARTRRDEASPSAHRRVEHARVERRQRRGIEQERVQLDEPRRGGLLLGEQARGPEQRPQRHHASLADVVDRGVRHLREPLAEEAEQRPDAPGERRQRRVVAHRRDRLVALRSHRP